MRSGPRTLARRSDAFVENWIGKAPSGWRALLPPEAAGKGLDGCPALFAREAGRLFPSAGKTVGADDAVGPLVRFHRTASFAVKLQLSLRGHTFSGLSEKVCKKRRWMRIGLYRKPQNHSVERHCSQHTRISLQGWTTAPPAWKQRSHRKQLPRKEMVKHAAVQFRTHLRMRRWCHNICVLL